MPIETTSGQSRMGEKSLKELMHDLSEDSVELVRQETELFKKEMEVRISKVEREVTVLGGGGGQREGRRRARADPRS